MGIRRYAALRVGWLGLLLAVAAGCSYEPPDSGNNPPAPGTDTTTGSDIDGTTSPDDTGEVTDRETGSPADTGSEQMGSDTSTTCTGDVPCDCDYNGNPNGVCGNATKAPGTDTCREPAAYESTEKSCDNKDNDCDGQIDEDLARPCGKSTGPCKKGTQTCLNGQWGPCEGEVEPSEETCDGKDNDCDGKVDEKPLQICGFCEVCTDGSCQGGC